MDFQARGFHPICIAVPVTSALIVALVLAAITFTVSDKAQPFTSAHIPSAGVVYGPDGTRATSISARSTGPSPSSPGE